MWLAGKKKTRCTLYSIPPGQKGIKEVYALSVSLWSSDCTAWTNRKPTFFFKDSPNVKKSICLKNKVKSVEEIWLLPLLLFSPETPNLFIRI